MVNIILGAPYETIVRKRIELGYATSMAEVIRQALLVYERELEEEEARLVHSAVEFEMEKIRRGEIKTIPLEEIEKKYGGRK